jgi:hypothetical protein
MGHDGGTASQRAQRVRETGWRHRHRGVICYRGEELTAIKIKAVLERLAAMRRDAQDRGKES